MARTELLTTEEERHRQAFELYVSLGARRSYARVANPIGVSTSTIKLWSRSFQWRQRLREQDANLARQAADRAMLSNAEDSGRNLKIVRVALMKVAKAIAEGKVRIQMGDLDRLVRLEGFLTEQRGDSTRPDLSALSDEELIARMRQLHVRIGKQLAEHDAANAGHGRKGATHD